MPKSDKYVPTHRAPGKHKAARAPRRALRTGVALTGLAAAVTGVSVTGGLSSERPRRADPRRGRRGAPPPRAQSADARAPPRLDRGRDHARAFVAAGRSSRSCATHRQGQGHRADDVGGSAVTQLGEALRGRPARHRPRAAAGLRLLLRPVLLPRLALHERVRAGASTPTTRRSSAYGIPQALTELHELPADYMTSAESQIRWGLEYIQDTYGTPCSAWSFKAGPRLVLTATSRS